MSSPSARCPSCGSRLRPEESWCSLCHHNLLTDKPVEVAEPAARGGPKGLDGPATFVTHMLAGEPLADPVAAATADRLIAQLAVAEADRDRESGFGALFAQLGARGGVVLAAISGVLLLAVGILGLTLFGLLI